MSSFTGLPGSARLYCVISCMSVICLILLMVVIILAAKRTTCPDSCSSSTEANLGDHVDLGVSLTSPSPAILTTVQAKSRIYSGEEVTANSREDVSTVNLEKLCTEHFRKTSHSGQKDTANNRKDPSMVKKLCSEHWRSICAGRKRCPYEWHTNGSYCFFLSTFTLTWDQSQSKCSSICGSLAVIPSQEVQNSLTEKGNLMYWIGLKKHQSAWQWVNNKTLEKSYWTRNPGDRDCALLKSTDPPEGNWIKESCRSSAYFICQLKN
ncbi:C-type lectin domain family 4 member E [Oryzias melastigma]|uniref:C-type lectin domain family 4 member E n=1 Tax=Oryzias melastigma TaxID=30732 RepID=UPI00168CAF37|nr:C-type lectin domain family 4 member E [Oryzias melastigma]